jgi:predicted metal-dependent phosphoesterase TrpH
MLLDLHTHTHPLSSCSSLSLPELIVRSRDAGLDGLCLTEHDKMWPAEEVSRAAKAHDFLLLRGMEITTTQGHVLVYGLPAPLEGLWSLRRLRAVADEHGAILVKSHPLRDGNFQISADGTLLGGMADFLSMFDGFEIWSGGESDAANALAASIAQTYGLKGIGGGDVHTSSEIGRFATRFERPIRCEADLVAELRAGRFAAVDLRT